MKKILLLAFLLLTISVKSQYLADGTVKVTSYGTNVVMTVTNLQSLASSATACWQSARVSNMSTPYNDYEILIKLTTANSSPANDKAIYIYCVPWYSTDGGTTWFASDQGTATMPTGTEGTTTIASPNNLQLLRVLPYTTAQQNIQADLKLSAIFGYGCMPNGWSLIIENFSGAALSTSCVVDEQPLY